MTAKQAATNASFMYRDVLPEHWTMTTMLHNGFEFLEIGAPDGHEKGFVTVDLDRRTYRHGRSVTGSPDSPRYAGRGWRDRLIAEAIAWLGKNTSGVRMIGTSDVGPPDDDLKDIASGDGVAERREVAAMAAELIASRAAMKRIEAWADQLEIENTYTKQPSRSIAAEIRNRMKGGS